MTPTSETETQDHETRSPEEAPTRSGLLLAAAVAVVAIPVLVGFYFLAADDAPQAVVDPVAPVTSAGAADDGAMGGATGAGMGGAEAETGGDIDVAPTGIGDFTEIQASDIVIAPDPSGGGAILEVTTSLDVACAVSYGPTAELGSLATDTDMAGGGHTDHHPLMSGLTDGTTYFYRVSAIAPDGRTYQSDVMQFTHESAGGAVESVPPPAPNVADMGRVTDVSSEYPGGGWAAANAIDGDLSTEWATDGDGDDAYLVVEFGEEMRLEGVGFRTRSMTDGTSITSSFSVTVDGRSYGPFEAGPGLSVGLFEALGRTVRVDVESSSGGNTGAIEIEIYGQTDM